MPTRPAETPASDRWRDPQIGTLWRRRCECTLSENECTLSENECTLGENECTLGENECTLGER